MANFTTTSGSVVTTEELFAAISADAIAVGGDFDDAVYEVYEETCERLGLEITEEIDDAVMELSNVGPITTGGGDNLDKNSIEETVHTTTNEKETATMNLTNNFDAVFAANDMNLVVKEGNIDVAAVLASIVFECEEPKVSGNAKIDEFRAAAYAEALAKVEEFVNVFGGKLGYVNTDAVFAIANSSPLVNNTPSELEEFLGLFNYVGVNSKGEPDAEVEFLGAVVPAATEEQKPTRLTAGQVFFGFVAGATANLTAEEYASLLVALNPEAVEMNSLSLVDATTVAIRHIQVDFANNQLAKNGYVLTANKGSMFIKEGVDVLGTHALFLFAMSIAGSSKRAINTLIGLASNLFKRQENYGDKAQADDIRYHVDNNLVLCMQVKGIAVVPFFQIKTAKQAPSALRRVIEKGIMAAVDKTNVKWLTTEKGALAMGLGQNNGIILNLNDASKPNKVYNRPASNKYSWAYQANRVRSNFAFDLGDGDLAFIKGRSLRTLYTNSRFCPGSGVALTNPELLFEYEVNTTLSEPVNVLTFPAELRAGKELETYRKEVLALISDQMEVLVGNEYAPGETIVALQLGEETRTLINNSKKAVKVRVDSYSVVESDFNDDVIDVKVNVSIVGADRFLKLRTPFYKATVHPYDVKVAATGAWDIILNNETVKGQNALLVMWANAQDGVVKVDMNAGTATVGDRVIDLTVLDNEVKAWREANVKVTTLTFDMAASTYHEMAHLIDGKDDVKVIARNGNTVTIQETVEYIAGTMNFDIEIATPRECVGTSNLTFEQQCAILLQDRVLGESIMKGLAPKVKNMVSLVDAYAGAEGELPEFDLATEAGRDEFATKAFGRTGVFVQYVSNHRAILKALEKAFSTGFVLKFNDNEVVIHPKALLAFGQFSKNGSSAREVAKVVDFIHYVMNVDYSDINDAEYTLPGVIADAASVVTTWSSNLVNSAKALKKVTRAGDVVCGKVRTSFAPFLHSEDGIPMVGLNPNCPMVGLLGVKEGDFIAINRTPMPFITVARVVFNTSIDFAHALISPLWWHLANEGK